ncbi:MAG: hypothetical protein ABIP34_19700 [Rhodoferax sp.]|uniref:hypothetical protein n=1 Tax=Rhodoferax sp. TaxID=50421 RepID=UPI0032637877
MTLHAKIIGHVTYTPGDGAPLVIPKGPVDIDLATESATLSWTADNGAVGLTAIPLTLYKEYVHDKKISLTD